MAYDPNIILLHYIIGRLVYEWYLQLVTLPSLTPYNTYIENAIQEQIMSKLNPEKLSVEFREGVSTTEPITSRRYTLTHSDLTAELFLTIGLDYAYDQITEMRDEVLGEWVKDGENDMCYIYLSVDGQLGPEMTAIRDFVFRRELPLALEAIRYGDAGLFAAHPELDQSSVIVFFLSTYPQFNKIENWGTFSDYDIVSTSSLFGEKAFDQEKYLLDQKFSDVTGDGVPDKVSMYGNKQEGADEIFVDNIMVVVEDGRTKELMMITPEFNMGYHPSLFLGDFTKNQVNDIKISIEAGGSGGYGYYYLYSFDNNEIQEIFNFDSYNKEFTYQVDYSNLYKVNVGNVMLDKLFVLDISSRGYDYVSEYYREDGTLKSPVQGEVLALGALVPMVNNEEKNTYDLMAYQRIIGTTNSDTLGYIENLLSWDGRKFVSSRMFAVIPGTNLISLY